MDELIGRNALEIGLFDEETKQVLLDRLSARLEGDKPRVTEISLTARDGSLYWVDIKTAILEKDGKPSALQLGFINITERKRAEAALRESEARYRQLGELSSPGPLRDRQGRKDPLRQRSHLRDLRLRSG